MRPLPVDDEVSRGADDVPRRPGRRRLARLGAVLAAGVALAVVRPELALSGDPAGDAGPRPRPAAAAAGARLGTVAWEQRGDLASDRSLVAAAVRRIRQDNPNVARVLYAGVLPDGSRLVLSGTEGHDDATATVVHALVVPPGAAPTAADVRRVARLTSPQQVLVWAGRGVDGRAYAVLLTRPGPVRFEWSARVRFATNGAASRAWSPVGSADGTAVVDLGPAAAVDPAVAVRAAGAGVDPRVTVALLPPGGSRTAQVSGVKDPAYAGPGPGLLVRGLRESLVGLVDLATARPRVVWSGAPWKGRRLALVVLTRADGVRLRALVGQDGNRAFGAGVRVLADRDPAVVPWLLEPVTTQDPTFLLVPTGAAVGLRRPGGRAVRLAVPAGGAVPVYQPTPHPPSLHLARVRVLDRAGAEVLRTTLPAAVADPLALGRN